MVGHFAYGAVLGVAYAVVAHLLVGDPDPGDEPPLTPAADRPTGVEGEDRGRLLRRRARGRVRPGVRHRLPLCMAAPLAAPSVSRRRPGDPTTSALRWSQPCHDGGVGSARWTEYVAGFHAGRPGITERVLGRARDADGDAYDWLAAAVPARGRVLDVACGSAPLKSRLPGRTTADADLFLDSLYLPDLPGARYRAARTVLHAMARARAALPVPIRRVVATAAGGADIHREP